jgi:hypothetical protein
MYGQQMKIGLVKFCEVFWKNQKIEQYFYKIKEIFCQRKKVLKKQRKEKGVEWSLLSLQRVRSFLGSS